MKKILVTQSSMPSFEEYCNEIKDLFDSKWLTNNGIKHQELETKIKEFLQCKYVSLFCNGHTALFNAIKLLDLKGEVITTPYTFISTTHAITQNGLKPVFCDINEDDYTIDTNKIESLITDKTSAILAVHVYGNPCNVEKIEEIAKKYNLKVIYDAAHAFGVNYKGKSIATFGDISMFSFHATKVFNTIEGGALTYNQEWYQKLKEMKNFGIADYDDVDSIGMNGKMNEFQAAMGLCNLKHFTDEIEKRKRVFERYLQNLKDVKGIKLPKLKENINYNYAYFPVLIENDYKLTRDELYIELQKYNIFTRKYFYPISSECKCYKNIYDSNKTPIAKKISNQILTLPLYADLSLKDVDYICDKIKKF